VRNVKKRLRRAPRRAGGEGRIHLQFPVAGRGKQLAGPRPAIHLKPVNELDLANIPPEVSPKTDAKSGKRRESVGKDSRSLWESIFSRPMRPDLSTSSRKRSDRQISAADRRTLRETQETPDRLGEPEVRRAKRNLKYRVWGMMSRVW